MVWFAFNVAVGTVGIVLILYGAYIDGQRQKVRKDKHLDARAKQLLHR